LKKIKLQDITINFDDTGVHMYARFHGEKEIATTKIMKEHNPYTDEEYENIHVDFNCDDEIFGIEILDIDKINYGYTMRTLEILDTNRKIKYENMWKILDIVDSFKEVKDNCRN